MFEMSVFDFSFSTSASEVQFCLIVDLFACLRSGAVWQRNEAIRKEFPQNQRTFAREEDSKSSDFSIM